MKKLLLLLLIVIQASILEAQNERYSIPFDKIYTACLSARFSLSGGLGSPDEMKKASYAFDNVKWSVLKLQSVDSQKETSINGHMVFVPTYFKDLIFKHKVYMKAEEYMREAERSSRTRGSEVQITTRAIQGKSTSIYAVRATSTLEIGVVSEVNGFVSWKITIKSPSGQTTTYKDNQNEYKGMPSRRKIIHLGNGISTVILELTNTTDRAKSYAIIVNS